MHRGWPVSSGMSGGCIVCTYFTATSCINATQMTPACRKSASTGAAYMHTEPLGWLGSCLGAGEQDTRIEGRGPAKASRLAGPDGQPYIRSEQQGGGQAGTQPPLTCAHRSQHGVQALGQRRPLRLLLRLRRQQVGRERGVLRRRGRVLWCGRCGLGGRALPLPVGGRGVGGQLAGALALVHAGLALRGWALAW